MAGDPNNTKGHHNFENTIDLRMALDNSNVEGVSGGAGPIAGGDDPQHVLTGIEFSIPLSQLPNFLNLTPTSSIRMVIFVNSGGHDFISNQFAGEGVLQGNFGSLPPDLETEAAGDQFVTVTSLPGDYNQNGTVDAADYTTWRDHLGQSFTLPNDDSPGVGQDDFDRWKTNFGMSAGGGSLSETSSAVPEPVGSLMAAMGALGLMVVRRRRAYMSPVENRSPQVAKTDIYTDVPFCDIVLRGT